MTHVSQFIACSSSSTRHDPDHRTSIGASPSTRRCAHSSAPAPTQNALSRCAHSGH